MTPITRSGELILLAGMPAGGLRSWPEAPAVHRNTIATKIVSREMRVAGRVVMMATRR
jgi:hypothetical protein